MIVPSDLGSSSPPVALTPPILTKRPPDVLALFPFFFEPLGYGIVPYLLFF